MRYWANFCDVQFIRALVEVGLVVDPLDSPARIVVSRLGTKDLTAVFSVFRDRRALQESLSLPSPERTADVDLMHALIAYRGDGALAGYYANHRRIKRCRPEDILPGHVVRNIQYRRNAGNPTYKTW